MLVEDGLRDTAVGFELDIGLNWYRSLPLSSIATLELTVNGKQIPRDEITFVLDRAEYALDDLQNHPDEMWFVRDRATLRVSRPLVRSGEEAEIRIVLGSRIPYLLVGHGRAFEYVTERSATLVAEPAA
jgi:hypothetical protein